MDSKSFQIRLALVFLIVLGYMFLVKHERAIHPELAQSPAEQDQGTDAGGNPSTQPTTNPVATTQDVLRPTTGPTDWRVAGGGLPPPPLQIGGTNLHNRDFNIGLICDSRGAAVDAVALTPFNEALNSLDPFTFQTPYDDGQDDSLKRSMVTSSITVDGTTISLWDRDWQLKSHANQSATYELVLVNGVGDQLEIDKQYTVSAAQTGGDTPQGFEVGVTYTVRNSDGGKPHGISLELNGPTVPKAEMERQATEIVAGYDADGAIIFEHHPVGEFKTGAETRDFITNDRHLPLLWLGASSNYFNAIVHLPQPKDQAIKFVHAMGIAVNPTSTGDRLVAIRFTTAGFTLPPGGQASVPLRVFFGPKSRAVMASAYYGSYPNNYDQTLVMVSGPCSICTFTWLIDILVNLLRALHFVLRDWGLAIIALVCIVRLILHPITKRSQVSMMKMQKLSPEVERLKKKFGDDKDGFAKAQMELYKSVGFTPVLGCLPMFLQMPIFIALWRALQTTFELRQSPFLFTWIHDLSQPDALIRFPHPVPLYFFSIYSLNVLPLAMAVVTYINTKYFMPKPAVSTPEQAQQQKMMQWMTLVFPFMFYSFPAGLNLYYLTTTTLGIVESKVIRDHIKEQEEREKNAGPIIVDGPPKKGPPDQPKKKGFLQRMQERAEQLTRDAEQQKKKKRKA